MKLKHDPFSLKNILDEVHVIVETQERECDVEFIHQNTDHIEHDALLGSSVYLKRIL